ncbi:MAG TPA: CsgG/HfaB family protein [Burkholderiaceae bacterium]
MKNLLGLALIASLLVGCDKKITIGSPSKPEPPPASVPASVPVSASVPAPTDQAATSHGQVPDVGKIEHVKVNATGAGMTPGAAINDALKTAVMQVNGTVVNSISANLNTLSHVTADVDIQSDQGTDSAKATAVVQGQHFAEMIISESHGLVSSFKVLKLTPPATKGDPYAVDIEAQVAKFVAPADAGKIKVVVAPLYSDKTAFNIGGHMVPAQQVLNALHRKIVDALSQTGRFTVLDRQFEGELQNELDMINAGKSVNTDVAKLGQALSADLVWVGVINDFSYDKHVRHLQTSTRDLVSFSGGWTVSQRMINLATRQIFQSASLQGSAPSIAPTTLGTNFDEAGTIGRMEADLVKKISEAILLRTFPVSVVDRDGNNVVLSQGGSALNENGRYAIYLQGKELKDPQTGQSLGRMENLCCEVVINRVTPTVSYGVLENVKVKLDGVAPGALIVHEAVAVKAAAKAGNATSGRDADDDPAPTPAKKPAGDKDW